MSDATKRKYLIVNADDFGLSEGVNRGVIEAHERGIVTSASLMITQPAAEAAAEYARSRPELSIGLHVDLGEWVRDGDGEGASWKRLYTVVATDDREAVTEEVVSQVRRFRRIVGREPTHIDSHQHVHRQYPVRDVVFRTGRTLGIPVRHFSRSVTYCGKFYGQGEHNAPQPQNISVEALLAILAELPAGGVTELACHPGDEETLESPYRAERRLEVRTLTDERVRRAIGENGIILCSFADYRAKMKMGKESGSSGGVLADLGKFFFARR